MSGMASTVAVTSRGIDTHIGRSRSPVCPTMATPTALTTWHSNSVDGAGLVAGDGIELIFRVPPGWPRSGLEIIGTKPPQAATRGPSISEVTSPTPPVEALIDNGTTEREPRPVQHGAGVTHGTGQGDAFVHGHVVEVDSHRQGRDLPLADALVGDSLNERADPVGGELPAIALVTNDLLRKKHGTPLES